MTTITLYSAGDEVSNRPFDITPENVEHYDFDSFGVHHTCPVVRFRLRSKNMVPTYLMVAVGGIDLIIPPPHWGGKELYRLTKDYIRIRAKVALLNGIFFSNHCIHLLVKQGALQHTPLVIDSIGNIVASASPEIDKAWAPILVELDDFRRIKMGNVTDQLSKKHPDQTLVTHGRLEPTDTINLNSDQIGRNRASNYALIHLTDGKFVLVVGEGMGLMELVRQVVAMNTDVQGITKDNIAAVRAALLSATVDQLGWDMSGTYTAKDYEGWEVTQRFNKYTRLITFRSVFDLVDNPNQGSVAFSVNVPFNDITPMRELLASLTKSKFNG